MTDFRTNYFRPLIIALAVFACACGVRVGYSAVLGIWFSPKGGGQQAIVEQIDKAQVSIDYRMYNFTSGPIGDALVRAHNRGLKVRILLDDDEARKPTSQAAKCAKAGIPVYLDGKHAISHNKARIFDGKRVMFGSFNDSMSAEERNSEELVLEDDPRVVKQFQDNFAAHLKHAERMEQK